MCRLQSKYPASWGARSRSQKSQNTVLWGFIWLRSPISLNHTDRFQNQTCAYRRQVRHHNSLDAHIKLGSLQSDCRHGGKQIRWLLVRLRLLRSGFFPESQRNTQIFDTSEVWWPESTKQRLSCEQIWLSGAWSDKRGGLKTSHRTGHSILRSLCHDWPQCANDDLRDIKTDHDSKTGIKWAAIIFYKPGWPSLTTDSKGEAVLLMLSRSVAELSD